MQTYVNKIRDLRTDFDKTQQDISQLLNTSQQYYSKYESEIHPLPINHLITLCNYYGVSADYILGLPEGLPYGLSKTRK